MWCHPHHTDNIHGASEHICLRPMVRHIHYMCLNRSDLRPHARPETHQNLIHHNKEHTQDSNAARAHTAPSSVSRRRTEQSADTVYFSVTSRHSNDPPDIPSGGLFACVSFGAAFAQARTTKNGGERVRTDDPLLAKQVLSQLSYTPTERWRSHNSNGKLGWWAREDLNLRPHAYQACALTS